MEIAAIGVFICAFEISSGPVTWVYLSEILQDKAYSLATAIIQIMSMLISGGLPFITNALNDNHQYYCFIWFTCGTLTALGTIFLYFFMKETKGLSLKQIDHIWGKVDDDAVLDLLEPIRFPGEE